MSDDFSAIYGRQLDRVLDAYNKALSTEIKLAVRDLSLSPMKLTRCYWPHHHFYPLVSQMWVPISLIRLLWYGARMDFYTQTQTETPSGGRWDYAIPNPLEDTWPWVFYSTAHKAMVGETIRYLPGPDEDREYVYQVTDDILKRNNDADMQRIVWYD